MKHWRNDFDIPAEIAYFNCAAISPLVHGAREAAEAALRRRAQPWRIGLEAWYEETEARRSLFAELMGCDVQGVALTPSSSYGLAVAANNLGANPGQRILVLADEFPSGIYTWRAFAKRTGAEMLTVTRRAGESWTEAVLAATDERVAIVSVPNVHWTDGALIELPVIAQRTREIGARLVIDASQSASVIPIDFSAVQPDFLVTVGYKWMMGPYGLSYLWVAERHRGGAPLEENWMPRAGSEDFSRLVDYQEEYRPGAQRFDMGHRAAFELTPAANVALKQLLAWRADGLEARLRERTDAVAAAARDLGLRLTSDARGPHLMGVALPAGAAKRASDIFKAANVHLSFRGDAIRIAPHLYNTSDDIARLTAALAQIA
jgi:selenocysteine lyase/cysteine desulfurase